MLYNSPPNNVPFGAPDCYGRQFEESDMSCRNCSFRSQCRNSQITQAVPLPTSPFQPTQIRPISTTSIPWSHPQNNVTPTVPIVQPRQQTALIIPPNETVLERLGKEIILRVLEAVCGYLAHFFRNWQWPK